MAAGFLVTVGVGTGLSACSATSDPIGPGGECFLASDCAPGLVCVEQPNKARVCSDDLTRVAGRTPPDGAAEEQGEGGADAQTDGPPVPPRDSGTPDTGPKPDSGPPPPPPPEDAGDQ